MDRAWWKHYKSEVVNFKGERYTPCLGLPGTKSVKIHSAGNSGAGAILLAEHFGASRVILLGYDCQYTDGKTHHHGSHPKPLGDAKSLPKWPKQFREIAGKVGHVEIINATRQTALNQWPKQTLEQALCDS